MKPKFSCPIVILCDAVPFGPTPHVLIIPITDQLLHATVSNVMAFVLRALPLPLATIIDQNFPTPAAFLHKVLKMAAATVITLSTLRRLLISPTNTGERNEA